MQAIRYEMNITPSWNIIQTIKKQICEKLNELPRILIEFTELVSSELLENAVKYGVINDEINSIHFSMDVFNDKIILKVKNGILSQESAIELIYTLNKIIASENKEKLYIERLDQIMNVSDLSESKLGLYRIVSETDFDLRYEITDKYVEIIASRNI